MTHFAKWLRNTGLAFILFLPVAAAGQSTVTTNQEQGDCTVKVIPDPCVSDCHLQLTDCEVKDLSTIQLDVFNGFGQQVTKSIPYQNGAPRYFYHIDPNDPSAPGIYIIRTPKTGSNSAPLPLDDDSDSVSDL